ncbi:hypothetical protein FQN54_006506 [Arachnomyces sp. PD_36]|nr:hypothetical protein FQN54_006506 [Arachnomyces sp. PD_36]
MHFRVLVLVASAIVGAASAAATPAPGKLEIKFYSDSNCQKYVESRYTSVDKKEAIAGPDNAKSARWINEATELTPCGTCKDPKQQPLLFFEITRCIQSITHAFSITVCGALVLSFCSESKCTDTREDVETHECFSAEHKIFAKAQTLFCGKSTV